MARKTVIKPVHREIAESFQSWLNLGSNNTSPLRTKVKVFDRMADRRLKRK
jgi:hypothetical protein